MVETEDLFEFGGNRDRRIATFAGQAIYHTDFDLQETGWAFLDLGLESQVTEVKLNGKVIGVKWWGRHLYQIPEGTIKEGENQLEITYTTTLANYANSLTGNDVAKRWINLSRPEPMGLNKEVRLLKALPASGQ